MAVDRPPMMCYLSFKLPNIGDEMGRSKPAVTPSTSTLVGYVRVSADEQSKGYGLQFQAESIRQWCASSGYTLVGIESDDAISGTTAIEDRPGLAKAVAMVESREADNIIAYDIDRYARDNVILELLRRRIKAASGENFYAVRYGGLVCDMFVDVMGLAAKWEREKIVERTSEGRKAKAASGKYAGGKVPYGYLLDGIRKDAKWLVNEYQADIVREIFNRRANSESLRAIANDLNNRGVPAPRGDKWVANAILRIVSNRVYLGYRQWSESGEGELKGDYDPIVDSELFEKVAKVNAALSRASQPTTVYVHSELVEKWLPSTKGQDEAGD